MNTINFFREASGDYLTDYVDSPDDVTQRMVYVDYEHHELHDVVQLIQSAANRLQEIYNLGFEDGAAFDKRAAMRHDMKQEK